MRQVACRSKDDDVAGRQGPLDEQRMVKNLWVDRDFGIGHRLR
jgi:hypothetical protein